MEEKKQQTWRRSENSFFIEGTADEQDNLKSGIYYVEVTPKGVFYLNRMGDKFEFDYKIYGLEQAFIDKVKTVYHATKGNLGMILNGLKGTGKTVTGEMIANALELPIIIIQHQISGINTFISAINQDIIVFIDEYDKVYGGKNQFYDDEEDQKVNQDSSLLSLMDGVLNNDFRKVFILTTNRTWVNENMLNRPGRIRYLKEFKDLTLGQINEIIDDCLKNTAHRDDIISFIKPLKIITVDIVKTIISEVNIFNVSPYLCCKDLNVEFTTEFYRVCLLDIDEKKDEKKEPKILINNLNSLTISQFMAKAKSPQYNSAYLHSSDGMMYKAAKKHDKNNSNVYEFLDYYSQVDDKPFKVVIEKTPTVHRIFADY